MRITVTREEMEQSVKSRYHLSDGQLEEIGFYSRKLIEHISGNPQLAIGVLAAVISEYCEQNNKSNEYVLGKIECLIESVEGGLE